MRVIGSFSPQNCPNWPIRLAEITVDDDDDDNDDEDDDVDDVDYDVDDHVDDHVDDDVDDGDDDDDGAPVGKAAASWGRPGPVCADLVIVTQTTWEL